MGLQRNAAECWRLEYETRSGGLEKCISDPAESFRCSRDEILVRFRNENTLGGVKESREQGGARRARSRRGAGKLLGK